MKDNEFLDNLFNKARNEQPLLNPNDPLDNLPQSNNKFNIKSTLKKLSFAAMAVIGIFIGTIAIQNSFKDTSSSSTQNNIDSALNTSLSPSNIEVDSINQSIESVSIETEKSLFDSINLTTTPITSSQSNNHLSKKDIHLKGDLDRLQKIQSIQADTFIIDAFMDTTIITKFGSKFFFEGQGIVNAKGQVVKGEVCVAIKECLNLSSCIREDLSTNCNGDFLETAGMFHLQLTQAKDTLQIRTGYDVGIRLKKEVDQRFDLYYGQRNNTNTINWELDVNGRTPSPIIVVTDHKYEKVFDPFFYKNYRFEKSDMLQLLDSSWENHFTTDNRKIKGLRSCGNEVGPALSACMTFNEQLAPQLAKMPDFNINSRMTIFGFTCFTKNQYAYAMSRGSIDSVKSYIPVSDYNNINIPLFFTVSTGWLNLDCQPYMNLRWKKSKLIPKINYEVDIPEGFKVNAYLYLSNTKSIVRVRNIKSGRIEFENVPEGETAQLIITSYLNDKFLVFNQELQVGQHIGKINFYEIEEFDDYIKWLDNSCKGLTQVL
ncbi:MAG: hypothetical protein IT245_08825 [Bacteroidia bacterium]|nr:hypothetical protein [Bacteroidia bacterium]